MPVLFSCLCRAGRCMHAWLQHGINNKGESSRSATVGVEGSGSKWGRRMFRRMMLGKG
jgi:hypothetical protein